MSQGGNGQGPLGTGANRYFWDNEIESGPGGGGAGMGGALAILKADVRLEGVSFINNKAIGGKGGYSKHSKGPWNGFDYDQYSGGGGGSIFSSGASRTPWGNNANGRNGGIGAGGGGSMAYYSNSTKGGVGGFGGGGGGGDGGTLHQRWDRYSPGIGGSSKGFGGNGADGSNSGQSGGGGGGAGLGGAIYIHEGSLTIKDSNFEANDAIGGVGGNTGANDGGVGGNGQGVGGAIFVHKDAVFNSRGGVTYNGNSAQTSDPKFYIMEGGEYDTAPPVVAGTFNGEVAEKNEGEESIARGAISISDADVDDNPQFEDIEIEDNYGSFSLANGNWNYTLDQSKVQGLSQGDLISNKIKLTATDGTEQIITIKINGSNDAPVGVAASVVTTEDGDAITGQLSSTDADELVVFEENFDSLSLKPFESSSEKGGDGTDWTDELYLDGK